MNEVLLAPFTALGVAILLSAPEKRGKSGPVLAFAAAGLAFGTATWIKYVPAIPAALVGGLALIGVVRRPDGGAVRAVALGTVSPLGEVLAHEAEAQVRLGATQDHRDAVEAFLAKEKPVFHGR